MLHRLLPIVLLIGFTVTCSTAAHAHDDPVRPYRGPRDTGAVLVFSGTGWYRHPETAAIAGWLARQSDDLGMQVDVTESPKDLVSLLDRYDVLVLNNCTEMTKLLDAKQQAKVQAWYEAGGGIVALHAALVRQKGWPWFSEMAGCDFDSDSEYLEAKILVDPAMKDHPTVKGLGDSFTYKADWTNHDGSVTGKPGFKVLLRVDETSYEAVRIDFKDRGKAMGKDHPIAWLHENGGGRFFYTEIGHDVRSLNTKFGRQHVVEAIRWAAGSRPAKSEVSFEDSFERDELGARWQVRLEKYELHDGKLVGTELPEKKHGAVIRTKHKFENSIFEFSYRIGEGKRFNFVINDKNCKSVHAGHICRVTFAPNQIRIGDDKEGAMKNEIRAVLKDTAKKADRNKILEGRQAMFPVNLNAERWHRATVSIIEDEISVLVNDRKIGSLKSSGIAHPTKTDFGFTVMGSDLRFDDVRVWDVK